MPKKWKRENNTGTIGKLKGKRRKPWIAFGPYKVIDGKYHREYIGTYTTYEEAADALKRSSSVLLKLNDTTTMDELFHILYQRKEKQDMKASSLEAIKTNYNHVKSLGKYNFVDLSTYHFQQVIDDLIDEGSSFSKVSKIKSTVKQIYDVAIENKLLTVNYAQFIDISRAREGNILPFPEEDIKTLFKNDTDRIAKSSLILVYTGLRIGEFLSLDKFKNFDIKNKMIIAGSKTKAGRNRKIPIHPFIKDYIDFFYTENNSNLFFTRDGKEVTPDYYRKYYHNPLIKRLGLSNYTPHSFRHNAATLFRQSGMSDKTLKLIMGHTDAGFTDERYVDITDEFLYEEMSKVK